MASMKTLGRQSSKKLGRLPAVPVIACLGALLLPSCLLQPKQAPSTAQNTGAKKKALPAERWQTVGGGMLGVAADKKGSKGIWSLDDGPKPGQRSLLIEYDLKPGGFVGA